MRRLAQAFALQGGTAYPSPAALASHCDVLVCVVVNATQTESVHRIEESVVRRELAAAGFEFVGDAQFLRNPNDPRDTPFFKATIPVDGFVLKFRKP